MRMPVTFLFTQLNDVMERVKDLDLGRLRESLDQRGFLPDAVFSGYTTLRSMLMRNCLLIGLLRLLSTVVLFGLPLCMNELSDEVRRLSSEE